MPFFFISVVSWSLRSFVVMLLFTSILPRPLTSNLILSPTIKPNRSRSSAGITICPFFDMVVVYIETFRLCFSYSIC